MVTESLIPKLILIIGGDAQPRTRPETGEGGGRLNGKALTPRRVIISAMTKKKLLKT